MADARPMKRLTPEDRRKMDESRRADEDALIARALSDAAGRHLDPFDIEFREDADVGREMLALLNRRFTDEAQAMAEAGAMREALALGFMPGPGGVTYDMALDFLLQRDQAAQRADRPAPSRLPSRHYFDDDGDFPF